MGGLAPALLAALMLARKGAINDETFDAVSSHANVGTFATAAALVAMAPVREGIAIEEISEA